jgi:hypothetical protein
MKILERYSTLSPIYQGGLTNHLSMMVTALRLLDVDEETVDLIAEQYTKEKGIFDLSDNTLPKNDFTDKYISLSNHYLDLINKSNPERVIQVFMYDHSNSISSGLFHGIIRLSYAYISNDYLQIAQALSYFDLISGERTLIGEQVQVSELKNRFKSLVEYRKMGMKFANPETYLKFNALYDEDFIRNNLFYPENILKNKSKILDFFIDEYNKTEDFYILHVITGFHALHILEQFIHNLEQTYNNFFMESLIFMLINDHINYKKVGSQMEFYDLVKKVHMLRDAHDIKFFYTLAFFNEKYDNDKLKFAATNIFKRNKLF